MIWLPLWFPISVRFTARRYDCPAMSAGCMAGLNPCTVSPIAFIAKSKTPTREFGFCGRSIGFVVAKRAGVYRPTHSCIGQIELTPFSQTEMVCCARGHG